jgi:hypothetical protein
LEIWIQHEEFKRESSGIPEVPMDLKNRELQLHGKHQIAYQLKCKLYQKEALGGLYTEHL